MWTDMILGNPGASPSTLSVGTGRLWAGTVFLVFLHPAHGGRRALEGSQTKGAERTDMPRKSNTVDALKKLREQREELAAKEAKLRDEAAIVLGHILIECGAETIEPAIGRAHFRLPVTNENVVCRILLEKKTITK